MRKLWVIAAAQPLELSIGGYLTATVRRYLAVPLLGLRSVQVRIGGVELKGGGAEARDLLACGPAWK